MQKIWRNTYKQRDKDDKIKSVTKTIASKNKTESLMIANIKNDLPKYDLAKVEVCADSQNTY